MKSVLFFIMFLISFNLLAAEGFICKKTENKHDTYELIKLDNASLHYQITVTREGSETYTTDQVCREEGNTLVCEWFKHWITIDLSKLNHHKYYSGESVLISVGAGLRSDLKCFPTL